MRRLTVFCKLAFLWAGIGFSDNFTVKAPNVTIMESTKKQVQNEDSETCKIFFLNCKSFGS